MSAILGLIGGIATAMINNQLARKREEEARQQNYSIGEQTAQNAYNRQISYYTKFLSPEAQMEQYKNAGLAPQLVYSNGVGSQSGIGGGTQGTGSGNIQPNIYSLTDAVNIAQQIAQIDLIKAQTEKTKEETNNVWSQSKLNESITAINYIEKDLITLNWDYAIQAKEAEFFKMIAESRSAIAQMNIDEATQNDLIETIKNNRHESFQRWQNLIKEGKKIDADIEKIYYEAEATYYNEVAIRRYIKNILIEKGLKEEEAAAAASSITAIGQGAKDLLQTIAGAKSKKPNISNTYNDKQEININK